MDARFAHNPYVAGEPFIKFYAGAPLIGSRGERYGTLCIVDLVQRAFTAEMYALLTNFAALATEELERNKPLYEKAANAATNHVERNRHLDMSLSGAREGMVMVDAREVHWPIIFANPAFEASSGLFQEGLIGCGFWKLFRLTGTLDLEVKLGRGDTFDIQVSCQFSKDTLTLRLMPASSDRFAPSKATGIPAWVPSERAPLGSKLGLDVDPDKVVDVTERDTTSIPDAKCFWYAIVINTETQITPYTSVGDSAHNTSSLYGSPDSMLWSSNLGSAFGEFRAPAAFGDLQMGPLLGSGSFGKVYRGVDERNVAVAVKVVDCRGRGSKAGERQLDEVRLACDFDHAAIVKTIAYASTTEWATGGPMEVLWIVQELCDLGTLTDATERGWLRVERSMTAAPNMAVVFATMRDIAEGMEYLHARHVIHADLTGRNVLLASSEASPRGFVAKICDFGMSRLALGGEVQTDTFGTVTHCPPELLCDGVLCPAADVWAFGIIAWEAYTGKRAYAGRSPTKIVLLVGIHGSAHLELPPETPVLFAALVGRCLKFDLKERPAFSEVAKDLAEHLH